MIYHTSYQISTLAPPSLPPAGRRVGNSCKVTFASIEFHQPESESTRHEVDFKATVHYLKEDMIIFWSF